MTDRELLELAAKAAGLAGTWDPHLHDIRLAMFDAEWWNPLTDDGDALRLAVRLGIKFSISYNRVSAIANPGENHVSEPVVGDDEMAATRRAIVRAAAEIGKAAA
jgi:hypothetical protein